jgi:hypothetical protein
MEKMLIQSMAILLDTRPDCFSVIEGDVCFLERRMPDWLCLAVGGHVLEFLKHYEPEVE